MNLFIDKDNDDDRVLDKHYNVEYIMANGKCATFNNILRKADDGYYWFSSKEDGFACVRQNRVTFMYCTDR